MNSSKRANTIIKKFLAFQDSLQSRLFGTEGSFNKKNFQSNYSVTGGNCYVSKEGFPISGNDKNLVILHVVIPACLPVR